MKSWKMAVLVSETARDNDELMMTFEQLGVAEPIRRAIEELGFVQPMPVQEEVIPYLLGTRNDVIALAQTGTGKTAAFGIPLLQRIDTRSRQPQAVVLSPTRELCLQIADDLNDFGKYIEGLHVLPVYGGTDIVPQMRALRKGVHIIVATPGRLIDLMERGAAQLGAVGNVVLDEADEMLNMGFSEAIDRILEGVPADRNTLLFSATMSREIEKIARQYLNSPKEIVVGSRNEGAEHVSHIYYMVNARDKYAALKRIVDYYPRIFAIVFCRTKAETQEVADQLIRDGYNAESLHGDLSQQQRDQTMQKFRQHTVQLLVATDVAARGLDVDDLTHVINYGLPNDVESYTHRSGRTGRAGKKGTSISIVHSREKGKIRAIEKEIQKDFVRGELPTPQEICKKQLYRVMDSIVKTDVDEGQIAPFMPDINRYFEYIDKDELIRKMVTLEFGRFLDYYAGAPEIETVPDKPQRKERAAAGEGRKSRAMQGPERGYRRLFVNLGKKDGFYPGEAMQFINRHVGGRVPVGHIELLSTFAYIEVPEREAPRVMEALNGTWYKNREVRCNDADATPPAKDGRKGRARHEGAEGRRGNRPPQSDYRRAMPNFEEEGWARRRPRKKK